MNICASQRMRRALSCHSRNGRTARNKAKNANVLRSPSTSCQSPDPLPSNTATLISNSFLSISRGSVNKWRNPYASTRMETPRDSETSYTTSSASAGTRLYFSATRSATCECFVASSSKSALFSRFFWNSDHSRYAGAPQPKPMITTRDTAWNTPISLQRTRSSSTSTCRTGSSCSVRQ